VALIQLSAPAQEPVTLADAKNHLRIDADITQDDALIQMLITAARIYGETLTGRSFITQQWRMVLDAFPGGWGGNPGNVIELDRGTVQSVDAITYLSTGGTWLAMAPATIATDLASMPGRVSPIFGAIWPIPMPQIGSVRVDYTAGYGLNPTDVPAGIRQWMLVRLTTLYEHREEVEVVARGKLEPLPFIDGMLDPYTVLTI